MGQSARATRSDATLDTVITNAVIVDHWGIVKADIGIRDGRIVGVGKAGNPDLMAGVSGGIVVRAAPQGVARGGGVVTAGGGRPPPPPFIPPPAGPARRRRRG